MTEARQSMLKVLGEFLPSLKALKHMEQIGLIGSMTTPKREPKDIDIVVYIGVDFDLSALAGIYRKMLGRMQSIGRGVDIFTFEQGSYIGRPCRYRECGRGIRLLCKADNCGRRHHLCNDLKNLNLSSTTLTNLPVQLYPKGLSGDNIPEDIRDFVRNHTNGHKYPTILKAF